MPARANLPPWSDARASSIIADWAEVEGGLLPLLHALQAEFGHVAGSAVPMIAAALNLSRAEVHGVLTFYDDFKLTPPPGRVIKFCRAEACQARGARSVEAKLRSALSIEDDVSPDGAVTLEAVYCLGLCASGPAALLDGAPVARLGGRRLQALVDEILR